MRFMLENRAPASLPSGPEVYGSEFTNFFASGIILTHIYAIFDFSAALFSWLSSIFLRVVPLVKFYAAFRPKRFDNP